MKKNSFYLLIVIILVACDQNTTSLEAAEGKTQAVTFPEKIASTTIYEVNIRQHTPEGTIQAFIEDLSRLKELGVGMLWIMPIQPGSRKICRNMAGNLSA